MYVVPTVVGGAIISNSYACMHSARGAVFPVGATPVHRLQDGPATKHLPEGIYACVITKSEQASKFEI